MTLSTSIHSNSATTRAQQCMGTFLRRCWISAVLPTSIGCWAQSMQPFFFPRSLNTAANYPSVSSTISLKARGWSQALKKHKDPFQHLDETNEGELPSLPAAPASDPPPGPPLCSPFVHLLFTFFCSACLSKGLDPLPQLLIPQASHETLSPGHLPHPLPH